MVSLLELIRISLSEFLFSLSNAFIVDPTLLEVCKYSRANPSSTSSTLDIKTNYGYCAATKTSYFAHKLLVGYEQNRIIHFLF